MKKSGVEFAIKKASLMSVLKPHRFANDNPAAWAVSRTHGHAPDLAPFEENLVQRLKDG
jgi:hypothetical protein